MGERTIADRQAEFQQWYGEWLKADGERTPESLLAYFKSRLCVAFGVL